MPDICQRAASLAKYDFFALPSSVPMASRRSEESERHDGLVLEIERLAEVDVFSCRVDPEMVVVAEMILSNAVLR